VSGRRLADVREVLFLAGPGAADDTSVTPRRTGRRLVVARVPRTAASGPVALARGDGTRSAPSRAPLIVDPSAIPPAGAVQAEVQRAKVFYGAQSGAELSYVLGGTEPATVGIELVRVDDEAVIARWTQDDVQPGLPQAVRWEGMAGGRVQRDGVYRFRVSATNASGAAASSSAGGRAAAEAAADGSFTFLRHRFPIAGAHEYGAGGARFGGGRGHQGEDVFAACGTPVVAARAGRVTFKQYEGRAGHYVVIDGDRTAVDYTYMHLRDAALVDTGDRVRTGELIGYVGNTGRASACHLHFEMWSRPGWYDGGAPFDPLPALHAWDATS
jgi:murein DD-endopeptidase MepM/ murein hydrolase activator NlpD